MEFIEVFILPISFLVFICFISLVSCLVRSEYMDIEVRISSGERRTLRVRKNMSKRDIDIEFRQLAESLKK